MRALFSLTLVAGGLAHADTAVHKLTFDQVMMRALAGPKVRIAIADQRLAEARVAEADAARYPRARLAGFGTASPRIRCLDATCATTDPTDFAFKYQGVYAGVQLEIV
jgi:outer membrane protein TolC